MDASAEAATRPATIRVATLNLWGDNGPHERRLELVADELGRLGADVLALQEVREVPGRLPNQAETLARRFGFHATFSPSTAWGGGTEGLAFVSRFPIRESAAERLPHATETEGRIVFSACLETPRGPLWIHTTHLSYRLHEGREREDQVMAVDARVVARAGATDLPQLMTGDFNTAPDADEIRWLRGATTLAGRRVFYQDAWATVHGAAPGITWARDNPFRAKMGWLPADRRIDYIFVTAARRDGRGTVRDARLCFERPDAAGVFPSDHCGVLSDIQIAPNDLPTGSAP
ncbi:MAG TPA: endonuclease/exonuclease/phosphatase family protein [Polyangia bacterium]|jgi:beta-glucosidase